MPFATDVGRPHRWPLLALIVASLGCTGGRAIECGPSPASASAAPASRVSDADPGARRWTFDSVEGAPPSGFELLATGGPPGRWIVRSRADAPSPPAVLAQEDSSRSSSRFALAVATDALFGDARVDTQCLALAGSTDRACGLVWRLRDARNYYLARANALENNVRFYYVEDGSRHEVAGWTGPVSSCAWHTLRADMRGDHVEIYWDGQKVIDSRDSRFPSAGRVGLWTKADSRTLFDDLVVRGLP